MDKAIVYGIVGGIPQYLLQMDDSIYLVHNPIFLNSNIFRRDEIKFVERDDDNNNSVLYSLSDFGTTGEKGVRKHEDYMKNYFISQYGAIKDIDFTPIFEELISKESEV